MYLQCEKVHKLLLGVDELSDPLERCQRFAELYIQMTNLREPTNIHNESVIINKVSKITDIQVI